MTDTLRALRERHLSMPKRRDQTAIDVPSAEWLCRACETTEAMDVLELGSGFSSWALRTWQRAHPEVEIWTIDDEEHWLEKTRAELSLLGLRTDHVLPLTELITTVPVPTFDLVFVDLDSPPTRVAHVSWLMQWLRPGGLLVLDDWHMPYYREPMTEALSAHGFVITEHPETKDQWGRFLASAVHQATHANRGTHV